MAELGSLVVSLEANIARFESDLNKAEASTRNIMGQIERVSATAAHALEGVAASIVAIGSYEAIKGAIDAADAMNDLAAKTGIATEELSKYKILAEQNGTTVEGFANGMKKLSVTMAEHPEYLTRIGVATKDAAGNMRSLDDVMADAADKFSGFKDGAAKSADAIAIFGKNGVDMIPMLNQGAAGFKQAADQAQEYGLILDGKVASAADQFNDKMTLVKNQNQAMTRSIAAELLPALSNTADAFLEFRKGGDQAKLMGDALGISLQAVTSVVFGIYGAATIAGKALGGFAAVAVEAIHGNFAGAKAAWQGMTQDIENQVDKVGSTIDKLWDKSKNPINQKYEKPKEGAEAPNVKDNTVQSQIDEYEKLTDAINSKIQVSNLEASTQTKLSTAEQFEITTLSSMQHLKVGLNAAQQDAIKGSLDYYTQLSNENAARVEAQKVIERSTQSSMASVAQMEMENATAGKSAMARQQITDSLKVEQETRKQMVALYANDVLTKDAAQLQRAAESIMKAADDQEKALAAVRKSALIDQGKSMDKGTNENEKYAGNKAALDAYAAQNKDFTQYAKAREDLERQHRQTLIQLAVQGDLTKAQFDDMSAGEQFSVAAGWLDKTTSQAAQHSRTMFEMNKAAKLAQAALALHDTVIDAYAWGNKFGGPVGGTIAAGIALAAQLINIQALASASFGGSASSASAGGGGVGAGSLPGQTTNTSVPAALPTQGVAAQQQRITNIIVPDNAYGDITQFARALIPALNSAHADGYTLNGVAV
jgi:hypothetical protein